MCHFCGTGQSKFVVIAVDAGPPHGVGIRVTGNQYDTLAVVTGDDGPEFPKERQVLRVKGCAI